MHAVGIVLPRQVHLIRIRAEQQLQQQQHEAASQWGDEDEMELRSEVSDALSVSSTVDKEHLGELLTSCLCLTR